MQLKLLNCNANLLYCVSKMPFIDFDSIPVFTILPGFDAKLNHSEQLTFGKVEIKQGSILPEHSHHNEQVTVVLEGQLSFTIEGETKVHGSQVWLHT